MRKASIRTMIDRKEAHKALYVKVVIIMTIFSGYLGSNDIYTTWHAYEHGPQPAQTD
jgi:hypothetical protein